MHCDAADYAIASQEGKLPVLAKTPVAMARKP